MDIYDKYMAAIELIKNVSAVLPRTPENEGTIKLIRNWVEENL